MLGAWYTIDIRVHVYVDSNIYGYTTMGHTILCQPLGISILETCVVCHSVPTHPVLHEDGKDSGINMLEAWCWYLVGRTILYQPIPW